MKMQESGGAVVLAIVFILATTALPAHAQNFSVFYNFTGGSSSGAYPLAGLLEDKAGNFYGTTSGGGPSGNPYGNVYKLDANGNETGLYTFKGGTSDGKYPYAQLVRDSEGNLYGTTAFGGNGGNQNCNFSYGCGVVFKVDTSGNETVLYLFTGGTRDGCNPYGGLVLDKAGNLYGTTAGCGASGYGTVFKLSKTGKETVLYAFFGPPTDGAGPTYGNLLMDNDGNLYGVTAGGGTSSGGVVYRLSKNGKEIVLHNFAGGTKDGCFPQGTLIMDKTHNLYGTAEACGASNDGIVWRLNQKGRETVLHNFNVASEGIFPLAGVIMDANGNLFGDTEEGGANGFGTVYELTKNGTLNTLHSFSGSDGEYPSGAVMQDAAGNLYGVAMQGGSDQFGTAWKLTP